MTDGLSGGHAAEALSSALYDVTEQWIWMSDPDGTELAAKVIEKLRDEGYDVVPR